MTVFVSYKTFVTDEDRRGQNVLQIISFGYVIAH